MIIEIQIEVKCRVTDEALYQLQELLRREARALSDVRLKIMPPLPGQMSVELNHCAITAIVTSLVPISIEQFYTKIWEPQIASPLDKWLQGQYVQQNGNDQERATSILFTVTLGNSHSRHEDAFHEGELLQKRFPLDEEPNETRSINPADTLYAQFVSEANEHFYHTKNYRLALEKYNKAINLKDTSATVRANMRMCEEVLAVLGPAGILSIDAPVREEADKKRKGVALFSLVICIFIIGVVYKFATGYQEKLNILKEGAAVSKTDTVKKTEEIKKSSVRPRVDGHSTLTPSPTPYPTPYHPTADRPQ